MGRLVLNRLGFRNTSIIGHLAVGYVILGALRFVPFGGGFILWHIWALAGIGAAITSKFGTLQPWFSGRRHGVGDGASVLSSSVSPPSPAQADGAEPAEL